MLDALAQRAAQAWGGSKHPPRLLSHRENAVFEVDLPTGRAALRLHRLGYRTDSHILSELNWTRGLVASGFPAPPPVAMSDGDWLLHLGEGQRATVIGWMDGAPLGHGEDRLTSDAIMDYRETGILLARLHTATIAMGADQFDRPRWDVDGLAGAQPLWGRYWEMPLLTDAQRALIIAARDKARADILSYDGEITLIHTDALRENVFRNHRGLALIDFDDAGFGYTMYDLAASVTQLYDDPMYSQICEAILEGYSNLRPLRDTDRAMFKTFEMMRAFSALGWIMPRLPADHPKLPLYVRRACEMAEGYASP
jgi:Ser/Thr protein kinase RdoA (MazF antagonist)